MPFSILAPGRPAEHADGGPHRQGSELNRLMEVQKAAAPDFVWQLLDWTSRGDVVIIEWQTTRNVNGARFEWRGVDKFRIKDGKIAEERVYSDTAPLPGLPIHRRNAGADYQILKAPITPRAAPRARHWRAGGPARS